MERLCAVVPTAIGRHIHGGVWIIRRIGGDDRHCSFATHVHVSHVPHGSKAIKRYSVMGLGVLQFPAIKCQPSSGKVRGCEGNDIYR